MRISPITFKNNYRQNFTSTNRTVYFDRHDGRYSLPDYSPYCDNFSNEYDTTKMVYSNRTYFLRSDLSHGATTKHWPSTTDILPTWLIGVGVP